MIALDRALESFCVCRNNCLLVDSDVIVSRLGFGRIGMHWENIIIVGLAAGTGDGRTVGQITEYRDCSF